MRRRALLARLAAGAAGVGVLSGQAAADDDEGPRFGQPRAGRDTPAEAVDAVEVAPFPPYVVGSQRVDAGTWIDHTFAFTADSEAGLEPVYDQLWVEIDGHEIDDPTQYFGDVVETDDGGVAVYWHYVTPPKPPGEYRFATGVDFQSVSGTYTVVDETGT